MVTSIKKIIALVLCVVVLSGGLIVPQRTYAIPVIDFLLNALTGTTAATGAANWVTQLAKWAKDELAKSLRDQIVKAIVNEINKQTVNWIKGNGSPKFVSDWQGFMKTSALEAVNQTISQSKLADLCTPFAPQLRIALIPETKPISQKATCTLKDIVSNVQGFYDNFQNGGWLAYGEAIKPQNNLYMQLVMFGDETKINTNARQDAAKQEAGAGSGFLSVSKCEADNSQELYDQCVLNNSPGLTSEQDNACYTYAAANAVCTKKKVQTPGDAVAASVKNMIGSDNIYVSGVQSIISAAINAGINRMMTEGLALMKPTAPAGSGFNPASQFQPELDAFASSTKRDLKGAVLPTYNQWKVLLDIKKQTLLYIDQAITNLNTINTLQKSGVACPPVVADGQEIASLTATKAVANGYMNVLQPKVTNAENILKQIDQMDTTNIRQSSLINDAITNFSATYVADDPKNSGASFTQARQDALDEQSGINNTLNNILTRLQTCQAAQAATAGTTRS